MCPLTLAVMSMMSQKPALFSVIFLLRIVSTLYHRGAKRPRPRKYADNQRAHFDYLAC
jgi:hypothetical protein